MVVVNQHSNALLINPSSNPRPRRVAAIERVCQATFEGETDAQRRNREQREAQLEEARLAEVHHQAQQEDAVAAKAAYQARSTPRTRDEWMEHLRKGLGPSIHYVLGRVSEGGDRYQQVLVYRAARLFNPVQAKTPIQGRAHALIETLRAYNTLNEDSIINSLKASWHHYKARACLTIMKKEVDMNVLQ